MKNSRLSGHSLPREGRVHLGSTIIGDGNGQGRTRCSCGEESPMLPSTRMRRAWHRLHKDEVRSGVSRGT
jgi:hypothetical protein